MSRTATLRKYGKSTRKQTAEVLFAQLPRTPVKSQPEREPEPEPELEPTRKLALRAETISVDEISEIAAQLEATKLDDTAVAVEIPDTRTSDHASSPGTPREARRKFSSIEISQKYSQQDHEDEEPSLEEEEVTSYDDLRVLSWADVCPAGDRIEKIAEASYAEVYRITNAHGTSIIKVVRLESPIKPQTKAQERSGLVDEEPHSEEDMRGELHISEWLADIPGFVVYKEQYVVKGKATKALLETHQAFHRRMKRKDPDRLQYYPSPSRYLDETRFLVVELGDAGTALEDFELTSISEVWDIFLHTALALARAEDMVEFEHRDLHEGNLCIRRVRPPKPQPTPSSASPSQIQFGFSGLDITILDYGLSRATNPYPALPEAPEEREEEEEEEEVVAYDLEKDLSLFQSTHAPQCLVYRQMRSFLIHADRAPVLPASQHAAPYPTSAATGDPISWRGYHPYTNVLWLAYLYGYLVQHFAGDKSEVARFRKTTRELRRHLDPAQPRGVLSFPSAGEVVRFAVEAGWVAEGQLVDVWGEGSRLEGERSWLEGSQLGGEDGEEEKDGEGEEGEEGEQDADPEIVEGTNEGGGTSHGTSRPARRTRRQAANGA